MVRMRLLCAISFQRYYSRPPTPRIFLATTYYLKLRTGQGSDFKFSRYICRVHLNKSPLKLLEKRGRGRIQEPPKFLCTPIISVTDG